MSERDMRDEVPTSAGIAAHTDQAVEARELARVISALAEDPELVRVHVLNTRARLGDAAYLDISQLAFSYLASEHLAPAFEIVTAYLAALRRNPAVARDCGVEP